MTKSRTRRRVLAAVGSAATVGLAGCLAMFGEDDHDVAMSETGFIPEALTVSVGTTVVWKNTSTRRHTVTAYEDPLPDRAEFFASGGFESEQEARDAWDDEFGGELNTDDRFEHTFEIPGDYPYVCIPHETGGMIGTVRVEE